jgi:hypothetical protein
MRRLWYCPRCRKTYRARLEVVQPYHLCHPPPPPGRRRITLDMLDGSTPEERHRSLWASPAGGAPAPFDPDRPEQHRGRRP